MFFYPLSNATVAFIDADCHRNSIPSGPCLPKSYLLPPNFKFVTESNQNYKMGSATSLCEIIFLLQRITSIIFDGLYIPS